MQHEVSEGFICKVGRNYFMILTIGGQRQQRKTGTNDPDEAAEMLAEWRTQTKAGIQEDTRLRYEAMRDDDLRAGKHPAESVLRDLNTFFKNIRLTAVTVRKLDEFRTWREAQTHVVEYKQETLAKESLVSGRDREDRSGIEPIGRKRS
jgi:hypothetical protein